MPSNDLTRFIAQPERYTGVRALFNADLATVDPYWAPRWDWVVIDAKTIEHVRPVGEK